MPTANLHSPSGGTATSPPGKMPTRASQTYPPRPSSTLRDTGEPWRPTDPPGPGPWCPILATTRLADATCRGERCAFYFSDPGLNPNSRGRCAIPGLAKTIAQLYNHLRDEGNPYRG